MTTYATCWRGVRTAAAALLVLTVAATGCGRPPDEAWLRVVSIEDDNGVATTSITSLVNETTLETATEPATTKAGTTDYVTVFFANQSTIVGTDRQAGGVTVYQVQITYAAAGYALPGASYAVSLYVPVSTVGDTTTNPDLKIALVSTALKSWLNINVPDLVLERGLDASARLVFHARTDEGGELEVEAGIGIHFENGVAKTD